MGWQIITWLWHYRAALVAVAAVALVWTHGYRTAYRAGEAKVAATEARHVEQQRAAEEYARGKAREAQQAAQAREGRLTADLARLRSERTALLSEVTNATYTKTENGCSQLDMGAFSRMYNDLGAGP